MTESRDPRDWDFFEFPMAKLRPKRRPVLSISSSSDEEEFTSGTELEQDDIDLLPDDLFAKFQRQFSTLSVQTNLHANPRAERRRVVPSKYLLDETARKWSTRPTLAIDQVSAALPRPKYQDGRSKVQQQKSTSLRQTAVSLWQNFMPDRFLESHVLHWFNKKRPSDQLESRKDEKGNVGKERSHKNSMVDLDELKAFIAILYAKAASGGPASFESLWNSDGFSPPFFVGTMEKGTFIGMLEDFLNQNDQPSGLSSSPSALVNEFNYRLLHSFEPGDTLAVSDRTTSLRMRISQSPFLSPGGERIVTKKATISWLRDARCGFFVKVAPPISDHSSNDMIIDMAQLRNADLIKRVEMDDTLLTLVGQPPISGSGRTVFVGPMHAGVDCASDMYDKHKLRLVGQLPSSGFFDCRVPFVAKSRAILKQTIGSSLFLFDYPLAMISYQRHPAMRTPDVFISTMHFSKDKIDDAAQENRRLSNQPRIKPPSVSMDYQRFFKELPNPTSDLWAVLFKPDASSCMSLDKVLFVDCLHAAAYNAFILWKLEQPPKKQDSSIGRIVNFKSFLKRLASHLAKPYIAKRLTTPDDVDDGHSSSSIWRPAAKQILCHLEQIGESVSEDGTVKTNAAASTDACSSSSSQRMVNNESAPPSSKKQQRKQTKKRGRK